MKTLEGINGRLDDIEEQTSDLGDRTLGITQLEQHKKRDF